MTTTHPSVLLTSVRSATCHLDRRTPRLVAHARAWVRTTLAGMEIRDPDRSVELVADELVANAVTHSCGPIVIEVTSVGHGDHLTITVQDSNLAAHPAIPASPDPGSEHGRGLVLVSALADAYGCRSDPDGATKSTWACITPSACAARALAPRHPGLA